MSRVKEHTYSHKYNTKALPACLKLQPEIQLVFTINSQGG